MNEPAQRSDLRSSTHPGLRWRYLALGLALNSLVWGGALYLLKDSPRVYRSQWSVVLINGSSRAAIVPTAGLASVQQETTPNRDQEIKASYKVIAATEEVRKAAAAKIGMTTRQFGEPAIDVVAGSTLMTFAISGSTPEDAQAKARALHEALQERLNQLRLRQAAEQESGFENFLSAARQKLEAAQAGLSAFKAKSGISSSDQVNQLAANLETLRRQRAELLAQQQDARIRADRLSTDLKVSSRLAGDAFVLRSDTLFQEYVRDYSTATAHLTNLLTQFGPNHPIVQQETAKQAAAKTAMQTRAAALLGRSVDVMAIARLNVGNQATETTAREDLFKSVVTSDVEQQGLSARVRELDRQLAALQQRLNQMAERSSTLEALTRETQIAEAVFSSTLAGLDARKTDVFGSYPPLQLVAEPTLPNEATLPKQESLFRLATIASVLTTLALLGLWSREALILRGESKQRHQPERGLI